MLSQFYRSFLAVIAPILDAELKVGASGLANMSASFFIVFALAQFPLGVALDRLGPRRTVPALMLAGVAGALMFANARSGLECIVATGLIGLGCSPIYMGALFLFARTQAPERFGYLCSMLIGLGSLGNLLAATPLSLAAETLGWRGSFIAIAAITLASTVAVWAVVRDPPLAHEPETGGRAPARSSAVAELVQVLTIPQLWLLMPLLLLAYSCVLAERGLWVGPYFSEVHGLKTVALGNAALAMATAMSAGALAYGMLDRVQGRRKALIVGGYTCTAAGFLVLAAVPQPPVWLAVAALVFLGAMGHSHPLVVAHARIYFPDHLVGRGITFVNFLAMGGAGLLQWASGLFVSGLQRTGTPPPEVFSALHLAFGLIILASTAVYLLARTTPRARPDAA